MKLDSKPTLSSNHGPLTRRTLLLLALISFTESGCVGPSASQSTISDNTLTGVNSKSDLIRQRAVRGLSTEDDRYFEITDFVVNHIWGGSAYPADDNAGGPYRTKLSVYRKGTHIAELYFYDLDAFKPKTIHQNPNAAAPPKGGYYKLHFPINALGPIQQQFFQSRRPRLLTYYDGEWCIETTYTDPLRSE